MSNDAILISCGKCLGKMRWLALEPVTKADAKKWMWQAANRGDLIHTGPAAYDQQAHPICKCPVEERREEMIDDAYQAARE